MQIVVVSDLHLGDGGPYEIFAGGEALPALVASLDAPRTKLFVNGDAFDFLTNDDPLKLDPVRASERARAMCASPATGAVLAQVKRFVAAGGQVALRLGNHDVELGLAEVQAVVREALGVAQGDPAVSFVLGDAPTLLDLGARRVLVTHGEASDAMNRVQYDATPQGPRLVPGAFRYPAGSRLVKSLLNPLKRKFHMRYMDLLKPDFEGAVLTALATRPAAVQVLMTEAPFDIAWTYLRAANAPLPYDEETPPDARELLRAIVRAHLDPQAARAFEGALGGADALLAFDDDGDGAFAAAWKKLGRTGLESYARLHRQAAAGAQEFFELGPLAPELAEASRLATKYGAGAVVMGHTHAARWHGAKDLVYANTGTWIPLMRLPPADANEFEWGAFLGELRDNPSLDPARQVIAKTETQFHLVRIDGEAGRITLERQEGTHAPREVGAAPLPGAPA